jgi:hypothetical protein
MVERIRTIEELLAYYYGRDFDIRKADDPFLTTTPGVYNPIYGAMAWAQLNYEANAFGVIPKSAWDRSGWRVITTKTSASGVPEGGVIPDSAKPNFQQISTRPKQIVRVFENSFVAENLHNRDDAYLSFVAIMSVAMNEYKDSINRMLLVDNQTLAGNNFESIDRVVASNGELVTNSLAANSLDIYGLDRDAGPSFADAYVDTASSLRSLTQAMIIAMINGVRENGGNPTFFLTGYSAYQKIITLYETQARYLLPEVRVSVGVNGIQTHAGIDAGLTVHSLYGIPLIVSKDVVADSGGISRIYLLDTSDPEGFGQPRLSIKVLSPTMVFETDNPFLTGKFTKKGLLYMSGELICTFFRAQGKIRNIQ